MQKILRIIVGVLLTFIVGFSIYYGVIFADKILYSNETITLPNYRVYVVLSGSMEAGIKIGDIVVTKNISEEKLKVGDIISFYDDNHVVVTHRIVRIEDDLEKKKYITKGDYNNTEDIYDTFYDDILGVVFLRVPKMGKVLLFFRKNLSIVILALFISILFAFYKFRKKEQ